MNYILGNKNKTFIILAIVILLVNLFQAFFTELSDDEAYYWMFSQNLDWGYFDHPPMIALMIKAGYSVFANELGVRVFPVIFNFLSLILLRRLCPEFNPILLIGVFFSMLIFQIYGFVAVPDSPLLFFTILFYYLYEKYLNRDSVWISVLLGLCVALLLYSKYHGILVIFFVLLSNLRLFTKKSFYLVVFTAVLAYVPHIWWQVDNGYPSYMYHMLGKSHESYHPSDTFEYLGGLFLVFGPVLFYWIWKYSFQNRREGLFEKGLFYTGLGTMIFFLMSTLNSHGELNWTATASMSLIILALRNKNFVVTRLFKGAVLLSIVLFIGMRVILFLPLEEASFSRKSEFHRGEKWSEEIQEVIGDRPAVFINSYQKASKYAFYSGSEAHSMNNSRYRKNQYDLWPMEVELQGKEVAIIPNWVESSFDKIETAKGTFSYNIDSSFISFSKIQFETEENTLKMNRGEKKSLNLEVLNNYEYPIIGDSIDFVRLEYEILQQGVFLESFLAKDLSNIEIPPGKSEMAIEIQAPEEPGIYYVKFVIKSRWYPPFINSRFISFEVN